MKILISLHLIFLISCDSDNCVKGLSEMMKLYSDEKLLEYVDEIDAMTGIDYRGAIYFVNNPIGAAGRCISLGENKISIEISKKEWEYMNEDQRFLLILHEIGHCKFNFAHHNELFDDDLCPVSLMNSNIINGDCASSLFDYYVKEFLEKI